MKIVFVSDWFSEKMGYSENVLPGAMARLGHQVGMITTDLQPAFPNYKEAYEPFIGPRLQKCGVKTLESGVELHRLPHGIERNGRGIWIKGFHSEISKMDADIVQCFNIQSFGTYQAALSKAVLGYKIFLEDHTHKSVFRRPSGLRGFLVRQFDLAAGRLLGAVSEKCYPIAQDVAELAVREFGYPQSKITPCSLGVDTDKFKPAVSEAELDARAKLRERFGFSADDVVCLYSGRFSPDKNPLLLVQAIASLQSEGVKNVKALMIGAGSPAEKDALKSVEGCVVHPFVDYGSLAAMYQACDIGIWPAQESTSQLDAAACGLPLILSDKVKVKERVEGNGLLFKDGDATDLAAKIKALLDSGLRLEMGRNGTRKMREKFSWDLIAKARVRDYAAALNK